MPRFIGFWAKAEEQGGATGTDYPLATSQVLRRRTALQTAHFY